jgi:hypothetical protein
MVPNHQIFVFCDHITMNRSTVPPRRRPTHGLSPPRDEPGAIRRDGSADSLWVNSGYIIVVNGW